VRVRPQPSRGAEAVSDGAERLRTLVDQNRIVVTRILRRRGVPQADLDDEVQRTFMALAQRLGDVRRGAERSFVHGVAINVAWRARRRLTRNREVLPPGKLPEHRHDRDTPESLVERKETRQRLDGVIQGMPPSLRAVFILSAIDELTTTEIAPLLGIPRGTVASRLRRARAYLREQLIALEMADDPVAAAGRSRVDTRGRRMAAPAVGPPPRVGAGPGLDLGVRFR
jgi:RNA polymerase sigma-70 factor (ECF subfamily)